MGRKSSHPAGRARRAALTAALALAGCESQTQLTPPDSPAVEMVTILNYTYAPRRIAVWAGGAVLIRNYDAVRHTVTSEAAAGSHLPGAVNGVSFDTGPFLGDRVITIPAGAPVGTVVPYYCQLHGGAMLDEGEIEIVAPPSP